MTVQILASPHVGYRYWRTTNTPLGILRSMTRDTLWTGEEYHASCDMAVCPMCKAIHDQSKVHPAPDMLCTCGVYAVHWPWNPQICPGPQLHPGPFYGYPGNNHQLTPVLGVNDGVVGVIEAWGRIIIPSHWTQGFRAEHTRILALAYCVPKSFETQESFARLRSRITVHGEYTWRDVPVTQVYCDRGAHSAYLSPYVGQTVSREISLEWDRAIRERYSHVKIFDDIGDLVDAYPPPDVSAFRAGGAMVVNQ